MGALYRRYMMEKQKKAKQQSQSQNESELKGNENENNQENDAPADEQPLDIDNMSKDKLHEELKKRDINKPANTGIDKLRGALKDAING